MVGFDLVILGGGSGSRYSAHHRSNHHDQPLPKQFEILENIPVFIHSLKLISGLKGFRHAYVVMPEHHLELANQLVRTHCPTLANRVSAVTGGATRQHSALNALRAIDAKGLPPERVLIHDACRPLLTPEFLERIESHCGNPQYQSWIPVLPVTETIKEVSGDRVQRTLERAKLVRVQTPQIFDYATLKEAAEKANMESGAIFTDDASICEFYDIPVGTFLGDHRNIKLTYDFELDTLRLFSKTQSLGEPQCE